MKTKIIMLAFVMIFLIANANALICQQTTPITNIPCDVITPVLYCNSPAIAFDLNTSLSYSFAMSPLSDGTYKYPFNLGVGDYQLLLCDNSTTILSVSAVPSTTIYNPSVTPTISGSSVKTSSQGFNISVALTQYPYVDLNTTEYIYVSMIKNNISYSNLSIVAHIFEPNGINDTITIPYSFGDNLYYVGLLFDVKGDYPFYISANGSGINTNITSGTIYARKPYYVNVRIFNSKDLSPFLNNEGYVTAEFKGTQKVNAILEPFFQPIADSRFRQPVFHARYVNGEARIKLYENNTDYIWRLKDSITFNGTYAVPNIQKIFRTDIYLGELKNSDKDGLIQFILSSREASPYKWLVNILFIVGLLLVLGVSAILFFLFKENPMFSFIFGIMFTIIIVVTRIIIWWYLGF